MAVAAGAVAGAGVRWALGETVSESTGWPWALFVANVAGAFFLGAVLATTRLHTDDPTPNTLRLFVGTGFCGALTTFSTFAVDIAALLRDERSALAVSYLIVSLVVGIGAFLVGRGAVMRRVAR